MIKFCGLYEMNARWCTRTILRVYVNLEFKELLDAKRAYKNMGII